MTRKPVKRTAQSLSEPTIEQIETCSAFLMDLKPKFEHLLQQQTLGLPELDSLTNRFKQAVIDLYGPNSVHSQRFIDWTPYTMFSYSQSISDYEWEQSKQRAYKAGAQKTLTEMQNLLEQLELKAEFAGRPKTLQRPDDIQLLLQLCKRLPHAVKVLSRRRKDKKPFDLEDEYDAQDLLHAILRSYFKYSVAENPIPKIGGISSRADFSIEEIGVVIEVKFVHNPTEQERIVKQFAEDLQFYSQVTYLEHFIYVVYGADDLKDPEALDKLEGEKSLGGRDFTAYIVRC